ncbi:uncharacterized protein NEMAJ01_1869 [Nematocida major]|uniref:uncharacterized protein n=1 Tax=Nematocida major TaxID=1912982 RepID=UPI0020079A03|nr:uncharacterized protein NEMAJ01_1869 [Nematocida major]KAH9386973.1 hypothetical protein NEMAJ01_1869 [Nematocida major]
MHGETIQVFALGMIFYHGALSGSSEKASKVASVISLVMFMHKACCNMHMKKFIESIPFSTSAMNGSFLVIGVLTVIESVIVHLLRRFLPGVLFYGLERVGGLFIFLSLVLIFSSLWILSKNDIKMCVYIDQGIYAYIRHPYYLGLGFLYVGICLSMGNVLSIIIAAVTLSEKVLDVIKNEEMLLIERHKSYAKYRERVPSGIPGCLSQGENSLESFDTTSSALM